MGCGGRWGAQIWEPIRFTACHRRTLDPPLYTTKQAKLIQKNGWLIPQLFGQNHFSTPLALEKVHRRPNSGQNHSNTYSRAVVETT